MPLPPQMFTNHQLPSIILATVLISIYIQTSHSQSRDNNEEIHMCQNFFSCGQDIQNIGYPFYGENRPPACGLEGFELKCQENSITTIEINSISFSVVRIDPNAHTITLARNDLLDVVCPQRFLNTTMNEFLFGYMPTVQFLNLYYSCPFRVSIPDSNRVSCSINGGDRPGYYLNESFWSTHQSQRCDVNITVPALRTPAIEFMESGGISLRELLEYGFPVEYKYDVEACEACERSNGSCWSGTNTSITPTCICSGRIHRSACPTPGSGSSFLGMKILIGSAPTAGLCIALLIYCCCRKSSFGISLRPKNDNIEAFIAQYRSCTPKRYKYSEIRRMTDAFKDELGRGGFGSVFKGALVDGSPVAIKVLKESKTGGEEFINEVASIGRTSHVNIVALKGFCYEGRKRALVYEFMPNGSLEKFIHHNIPKDSEQHLGVEKLYEIALGIARGLEYLHRGCNTRILHFDIKPHNILLDKDFCPKISDFGLAKLHTRKESIISMVEARGTIGYIAPEVFNRNFGGVSHKSDVYSYGMMVLEIVSGRKNLDVQVVHSSEIYFPQWIYKRLELDEDFQLQQGSMTMVENEIARKMIIVGLWCIQVNPSQRPSMHTVIEMLEGSMETLPVPPNPFFSSPPRLPENSSTTVETISIK